MRVVFRAHYEGLSTEELFVVGGSEKLGFWDPAKAVKLTKVDDGLYQVMIAKISELDTVLEYKYLLKDANFPRCVKWAEGENRKFSTSGDELGVVLEERPFQRGISDWYAYEPSVQAQDEQEWGNYEYLKSKQSFWELWERPSQSCSTAEAASASGSYCTEEEIHEGGQDRGHCVRNEDGDNCSHAQRRIPEDGTGCTTKPKPFWMLHKGEFEQFEGSSCLQNHMKIVTETSGSREDRERRGQRSSSPGADDDFFHQVASNAIPQPATLYRSKNLPTYLLWRKPENTTLTAPSWT
ncbi:hypothetical protein NDN08_001811 [Rhodosorus marinus]|uniref:CBM20 domain-containing protein n=1 Tax=Rhodosorus marinus TaxID=101924 RepID=A0AAV8UTC6_9RHOD|nr:hypothetical protein NDN08_001811 [Rhodosorus marinus]